MRRIADGVFLFTPAHIVVEVDPSMVTSEKKNVLGDRRSTPHV